MKSFGFEWKAFCFKGGHGDQKGGNQGAPKYAISTWWACMKSKECDEQKQRDMQSTVAFVVPFYHLGIVFYWAMKCKTMGGA